MWTKEHRETHRQSGHGFPSDLTDAQWARLEPLIPPAKAGGRPRQTDMRAAMNAIFYLLRTGCPWRYLPGDPFPPRSTVYNIFRKFQREGVWERMWEACLEWQAEGLKPSEAVLEATEAYLSAEDSMAAWLEEQCERSAAEWTSSTNLFASWSAWANAAGENAGNSKRFAQALESRGFVSKREKFARGFDGLRLIPEGNQWDER